MYKELIERYFLMLIYDEIEEYENAIHYLKEYMTNNPNDPIALNNRGLAYWEIGKSKEALSDLKESVKINPKSAYPYRIIADILKFEDKINLAIDLYTTAIEYNENDIALYKLRAQCYEKIGKKEFAELDNNKAEKLQK